MDPKSEGELIVKVSRGPIFEIDPLAEDMLSTPRRFQRWSLFDMERMDTIKTLENDFHR
jgi:hypothetical protein